MHSVYLPNRKIDCGAASNLNPRQVKMIHTLVIAGNDTRNAVAASSPRTVLHRVVV